MSIQQRLEAALKFQPEMCSLNMGSMNFGLYPMLGRYKEFAHDWERPYLEGSSDFIFRNTFDDIRYILEHVGKGCGTRFEFECYDIGHLYNLAHIIDQGLVEPPIFVQTIFGILGGIGPEADNLMHMKRTADRLFGDQFVWSILGAGRHQLGLVTMGAIMGGNVRVGLEDNLFISKGEMAESNGQQVAKVGRILRELSFDLATPDEARQMLKLKGGANVAI